jgi:hypothetical protein
MDDRVSAREHAVKEGCVKDCADMQPHIQPCQIGRTTGRQIIDHHHLAHLWRGN